MAIPSDAADHRDRLTRRFLRVGPRAFANHELTELLPTYAIPRSDVKPLAKRLLTECGSIPGVLGSPDKVLLRTDGIGLSVIEEQFAVSARLESGIRRILDGLAGAMPAGD